MAVTVPEATARTASDEELQLIDRYWRATNYLSVGQIYLMDNPLLEQSLAARAHQAPPARPLGDDAGLELHLRAPEPRHQGLRPGHDLHLRAGARRARDGRQHVPRGHVLGALPGCLRGRRGDDEALQAVLVPRRHPEPRRPGDAGLDPRRRRARLRDLARVRRGLRQPRPHRRLRDRRRRGGDRPARDLVALEQVPEPRLRRRRAADPPPERLQDREPDDLRASRPRGAREPLRRLRLQAVLRRGVGPGRGAPRDGRHARPGGRPRSRRSSTTRARTASAGGRAGR